MIPIFEEQVLQEVCNVLGETDGGLPGSEIGKLLSSCGIDDIDPTETKRIRLFIALQQRQVQDGCGNNVAAFIQTAMNPVRYIRNQALFEQRSVAINMALAFSGMTLGDNGKLNRSVAVQTLSQAEQRSTKLRKDLLNRQVHPDVLSFCRTELLQDNYFHAVFEATKSIADKIRQKSGLMTDGSTLVKEAFGSNSGNYPLLVFNRWQTDSERSEHEGLTNMMKGIFGTFRNTTAHEPKIKWVISEQDALDMLSLASFLHRKLDTTVRTR